MNKLVKIILIVLLVLTIFIIIDTLQARIFKHSPILSIKKELSDSDSWVDKGIIMNTFFNSTYNKCDRAYTWYDVYCYIKN